MWEKCGAWPSAMIVHHGRDCAPEGTGEKDGARKSSRHRPCSTTQCPKWLHLTTISDTADVILQLRLQGPAVGPGDDLAIWRPLCLQSPLFGNMVKVVAIDQEGGMPHNCEGGGTRVPGPAVPDGRQTTARHKARARARSNQTMFKHSSRISRSASDSRFDFRIRNPYSVCHRANQCGRNCGALLRQNTQRPPPKATLHDTLVLSEWRRLQELCLPTVGHLTCLSLHRPAGNRTCKPHRDAVLMGLCVARPSSSTTEGLSKRRGNLHARLQALWMADASYVGAASARTPVRSRQYCTNLVAHQRHLGARLRPLGARRPRLASRTLRHMSQGNICHPGLPRNSGRPRNP